MIVVVNISDGGCSSSHCRTRSDGSCRIASDTTFQDAEIAAIALSRDAVIATRNAADFDDFGLVVLNPWETGG